MSTDYVQALDPPVAGNDGMQLHLSLNPADRGDVWIDRFHTVHQLPFSQLRNDALGATTGFDTGTMIFCQTARQIRVSDIRVVWWSTSARLRVCSNTCQTDPGSATAQSHNG